MALYVRRSTIDLEPDGLEAKEERLRSHAAASGHEVVRVDSDSAAAKHVEKREAFPRLIEDVRRKPDLDAILVRDVSRWSRAENTPANTLGTLEHGDHRALSNQRARMDPGGSARAASPQRETPASLPAFVDPLTLLGTAGKVRWLRR